MKKLVVLLTTVFMVACQSTELFDEQAKERDIKAQYAANFSKSYPDVTLNQNWDYSNKNEAYGLPTNIRRGVTRRSASDYQLATGDAYEVDNSTLTWMKSKLKDGQDNRGLGKPFYMKTPGNSFTIVPIFQGQASSVWELHAVIGGVDFKVWEKCQDVWVKKKKVTNSKYNYTVNSQMSSLNGMMLALKDCPRPANIAEDNEVMIIGCEDVYDEGSVKSDNDMNDVVFMVYGKPEVPSTIEITEDMSIEKKVTVRYMIEDLGSTDDFDFNDIVVDVSDVWTSSPVFTNGVLSGWTDSDKHQEAIVRHLGGILPFKLIIGSTELEEHAGVLGSNPDEEFVVSGWNKDQHNINVMVKQSTNSEVYNNVTFPKAGEAPMIIAVEPTQNWMKERVSVPSDWFYIPD